MYYVNIAWDGFQGGWGARGAVRGTSAPPERGDITAILGNADGPGAFPGQDPELKLIVYW